MNAREWTVGGLEFRIMMEQIGRDRLPFPLQFRPTAVSAADYHRQRHEASISVQGIMDDDLRTALHAVVDPFLRVEVVGHRKAADATAAVKVRAHAAIRHDVAAVLIQQPGLDESTGGNITVKLVAAYGAVRAVLAVLPVAGRGTSPRMIVDREVAYSSAQSSPQFEQSVSRRTGEEQVERLFARPRSSRGEILVCAGPAADSRFEEGTTGVQWVDFCDDGRYIVQHASMISVTPASALEVEAEIRKLVSEKPQSV